MPSSGEFIETVGRPVVARGWSEGEWEVTANGPQVFFRILYTFKRVNFLVCELYLIFFLKTRV